VYDYFLRCLPLPILTITDFKFRVVIIDFRKRIHCCNAAADRKSLGLEPRRKQEGIASRSLAEVEELSYVQGAEVLRVSLHLDQVVDHALPID